MRLLKIGFCRFLLGTLILGLSFSLLGAGVAGAEELTKVRINVSPYAMYQIWVAAHELGIDKEFGLDFEIESLMTETGGAQALIRGDLDVTPTSVAGHMAFIGKAPQVKCFSPVGFFKGFNFIGRKGKSKPFDELIAEMGLKKAKETRLKEFKGKTFCLVPIFQSLVADTLAQIGLTTDDIKVINFASDDKAAVAFIRGVGDFYIGSLPQQRKMLKMSDQFINAGGSKLLGPAGLWYDLSLSTEKYMEKNKETCLRIIAAKYRTIRLFDEQPEKVAKVGAEAISKATGGKFSVEEYITMQTVYDDFLSIEECLAGFYNPDSPLYWKISVDYNIKLAVEQGSIDKIVHAEDYYGQSEELFFDLLKRKDLLQLIYAPFPGS